MFGGLTPGFLVGGFLSTVTWGLNGGGSWVGAVPSRAAGIGELVVGI